MKFRLKPTRRNLIAIAAVVFAAGLGAFVVLDLLFANQLTPTRAVGMLEKASPQLVSVLKTDFGTDFSHIVQAAVDADSEFAGTNEVARFLDHQTRAIIKRYGDFARRAPPQLVADWMGKLAESMDRVQKVAGPELCSRFVNEGQSALTDKATLAELAPAFDARDAAFFVALAAARDAPASDAVGEPTNADWQAVGEAMNGFEVPAGYAQTVANDDTKSHDYCPALAYYFRIVEELPGQTGQRIRAEYFAQSFS